MKSSSYAWARLNQARLNQSQPGQQSEALSKKKLKKNYKKGPMTYFSDRIFVHHE